MQGMRPSDAHLTQVKTTPPIRARPTDLSIVHSEARGSDREDQPRPRGLRLPDDSVSQRRPAASTSFPSPSSKTLERGACAAELGSPASNATDGVAAGLLPTRVSHRSAQRVTLVPPISWPDLPKSFTPTMIEAPCPYSSGILPYVRVDGHAHIPRWIAASRRGVSLAIALAPTVSTERPWRRVRNPRQPVAASNSRLRGLDAGRKDTQSRRQVVGQRPEIASVGPRECERLPAERTQHLQHLGARRWIGRPHKQGNGRRNKIRDPRCKNEGHDQLPRMLRQVREFFKDCRESGEELSRGPARRAA